MQAAIVDGGGSANDVLRVYDTGAFDVARYLPIGTFELGRADFLSGLLLRLRALQRQTARRPR